MDKNIQDIAYQLCAEFIQAVCHKNFKQLHLKFGVSQAVWDEIQEDVLHYYFDQNIPELTISNENFEVFQYYQGGYGIEAKLETTLNDETGKWADLTLSAELIEKENSTFQFAYRLIEVM